VLVHRPLGLIGNISDGDLRRLLEHDGPHTVERTAREIMNPNTRTIDSTAFAPLSWRLMEERNITSFIVTGIVHIHDLWTLELISRGKKEVWPTNKVYDTNTGANRS
jgi:arabinose-5-phosphate isomerase